MTTSSSTSVAQNLAKPSRLTGCLVTALGILLAVLGVYQLIWGSVFGYIFASAGMLSALNIAIVLVTILQVLIYFFLVLRLKRQHWLVSLALLAVVWFILPLAFSVMINMSTARVRSDGFSMGTTLPNGSYLLADRLAYNQAEPQRGDIIVFQFPVNPDTDLIKRVIGLPGETVAVQGGVLTINGTALEEPYIVEPPLYDGTWTVPDGQYFVLGDNRNDSRDSHQWGFLPRENIIARVVWIYFPFDHFGRVDDRRSP